MNGISDDVLDNPEFQTLFLPMLRSDFKVAETYQKPINIQLPVPITCFLGDNDTVAIDNVLDWQSYTTSEFNHLIFKGDHFYFKFHNKKILNLIRSRAYRLKLAMQEYSINVSNTDKERLM